MRLRLLGVHNMESDDTRLAGYLVDETLALDAGSVARSLTFEQQRRIEALLISHEHNDHVRDLPALRHSLRVAEGMLRVYAMDSTLQALRGSYLPEREGAESSVEAIPLKDGHCLSIGRHRVSAIAVRHSVPAVGYLVSDGESALFYTGDTGPGLSEAWSKIRPDALLVETTFGNANEAEAERLGHLTPALLGKELVEFHAIQGYFPRVIVTHMSPPWEASVRVEAPEVAAKLGVDLTVARAGDIFDICHIHETSNG